MAETKNVTTALNEWNFNTRHVQKNMMSGDFVGSHSCIVCATVPRWEMLSNTDNEVTTGVGGDGANLAVPIGIVSDFTVQQQAQLQQLYEIGSKRKYTVVSGRTDGMMSIARAEYDGPSLLKMLYAFYPTEYVKLFDKYPIENPPLISGDTNRAMFKEIPQDSAPGLNDFWINMMSDIFTYPFGIMLVQKNSANNRDVSATLFENCYVQAHQMGISAGQVIIAESSTLTFDRVVPIRCTGVSTAPGSSESATGDLRMS